MTQLALEKPFNLGANAKHYSCPCASAAMEARLAAETLVMIWLLAASTALDLFSSLSASVPVRHHKGRAPVGHPPQKMQHYLRHWALAVSTARFQDQHTLNA